MKNFKKIIALCLTLCLVVGAFAACNKGDKKETKKDEPKQAKVKVIDVELTSEEYAFGVDKDQPELLKQTNDFIKEIKDNGTFDKIVDKYFGKGEPTLITSAPYDSSKDQLVVATNAAFEPFEYKKGDKYVGIDMEIAKLLADKLGKELVIKNMDFDAVCLSVGQHKCDIGMAGLTVKEERKEHVNFTTSYYTASQKIIVKGDDTKFNDCKTVKDVEKVFDTFDKNSVKIGVQNGTNAQHYIKGDKDMGYKGLKAKCVGYKNGSLAVQDMISGNINYVIIDSAPANCIVNQINALA